MTQHFYQLWAEARSRFSNQLPYLKETDLTKKLGNSPNSVGFLMRHIADVELLFAKNVFGLKDITVSARTVIVQHDTGEWQNLPELLAYQKYAFGSLERAIITTHDDDWETVIETKEFGKKTKAEALGRIVSHTAYHAGQLALAIKYGF